MNYRNQKGQALVELVLIMPMVLLILGGMVDFGFLFYNKQVITNASREGARAGIVYELDTNGDKIIPDVNTVVQKYCENKRLITFGGSPLPTTNIDPTDITTLNYPDELTVTVSFNYTFMFSSVLNWFGDSFGPTLDISATTVMNAE